MALLLKILWEGFKYALVSIFAIYAGCLMRGPTAQSFRDPILLTIPAITAFFFFTCYGIRFGLRDLRKEPSFASTSSIVIWVTIAVALLLTIIVGLLSRSESSLPFYAFALQGVLYIVYSFFLMRLLPIGSDHSVRHQLFWSVILSTGISLYYGLTISELSASSLPLVPVIVVAAFLTLDLFGNWRKWVFVVGALVVYATAIIFVFLDRTGYLGIPFGLGPYFYWMTLSLTMAGYLAVLEAWKVTSDAVKTSLDQELISHASTPPGNQLPQLPPLAQTDRVQSRYCIATLFAMSCAIWLFPGLFIFSEYGAILLVGFGVHAVLCFLVWYKFGFGVYNLTNLKWDYIKSVAGILFLVLLVVANLVDRPPATDVYRDLVSSGAIFGFGGITVLLIGRLINDYRYRRRIVSRSVTKKTWFLGKIRFRVVQVDFFIEKINAVRILCVFCFCAYVALNLALQRVGDSGTSAKYYRMELALIFYGTWIAVCGCLEFLHLDHQKGLRKVMLNSFIGLIVLSRIVTSALIAFAVFLPSLMAGHTVRDGLMAASPFFLAAIGGFALNDYFDAAKDRINKPYRAIPSGRLSPATVLSYGVIMLASASAVTGLVASTGLEVCLYLGCIIGVATYNVFVKYLSLSKTFLTSIISALPLLFSVVKYDYPTVFLLLPIATALFVLGREWLMDIRDVAGDLADSVTTIPMKVGPDATAWAAFGCQLLAVCFLTPLVFFNHSSWSLSLVGIILSCVIVLRWMWRYKMGKYQRRVIQLFWVPMLIGVLFFIDK